MFGKIVTLAAVAAGGVMLSKQLRKTRESGQNMSTMEETIEIDVPVSTGI